MPNTETNPLLAILAQFPETEGDRIARRIQAQERKTGMRELGPAVHPLDQQPGYAVQVIKTGVFLLRVAGSYRTLPADWQQWQNCSPDGLMGG